MRGMVLRHGQLRHFLNQPLENAAADFRMRNLAAAEEHGRLDLVPLHEEALDVLLLELIVVLVDLGPELDFLDDNRRLVLPGLTGALLFRVLIAPVIGDSANRRHRRRRNLHQVESPLACDRHGLLRCHDSELLPGLIDHAVLHGRGYAR